MGDERSPSEIEADKRKQERWYREHMREEQRRRDRGEPTHQEIWEQKQRKESIKAFVQVGSGVVAILIIIGSIVWAGVELFTG